MRAVILGTAKSDPQCAFALIHELQEFDETRAIQSIVAGSHQSSEGRDKLLAALRKHLATIGEDGKRAHLGAAAFESLAHHLGKGSFEEGASWIDRAVFFVGRNSKVRIRLELLHSKGEYPTLDRLVVR